MSDYHQPDFYRFNQDSIALVQYVKAQGYSPKSILDLGAGCGVIGLELAQHFKPNSLHLVEAQADFLPFIQKNAENFLSPQIIYKIHHQSFESFSSAENFDLMVCNPPYYLPGHGRPSEDPRRQQARTFITDGWNKLIDLMEKFLKPDGHAYFVIKNEKPLLAHIKNELTDRRLSSHWELQGDLMMLRLVRLNED